jgi:predicted alpha/beta-fold hydrolase
MSPGPFRVQGRLANTHLQSLLASSHLRRRLIHRRRPTFIDNAQSVLLDCGDGVRLEGLYSPASGQARGLVVLLHGWEGSVHSTYLLDASDHLHQAGFAVFRLNFRDHGDTHHLNTGIFHSCLIDEAVGAVVEIARRFTDRPLMLGGFSLGGNFALRIALRAPAAGVDLDHVVAVSPVISPPAGLQAIEDAPFIYERYFLRKFRRSLRAKQRAHPGRYDLHTWLGGNLRQMTRGLVENLTEFATLEDYLEGYSVAGERLAQLEVPVTILTSADDPVIPVEHFHELMLPETAELVITENGGHCGFIEDWRLNSWVSRLMVDRFSNLNKPALSE